MLTDAGAIALALVAARLAARPAAGGFTFGLKRAEILSAQVNGATLVALAVVIFAEGVRRLIDPPTVDGVPVLVVALAGHRGQPRRHLGARGRRAAQPQRRGRLPARAHRPVRVHRHGDRGRRDHRHRLRPRRRHRRPPGGSADAALGLGAAARLGPRAAGGGAARGRPRGDRPRARGRAPRGRGARPARMGGHLRHDLALGARDGARRLRHPVAPAPARGAAARALRHRPHDPAGRGAPRGAARDRAAASREPRQRCTPLRELQPASERGAKR